MSRQKSPNLSHSYCTIKLFWHAICHMLALPSRLAIIAQFPCCSGLTADWQVDAWCQIEVVKKFQVLSNKGPSPNQRCRIISTQTSIYNMHSATHQSRYLLQDITIMLSLHLLPAPRPHDQHQHQRGRHPGRRRGRERQGKLRRRAWMSKYFYTE